MKIEVGREHIERGARQRPEYCPIALALMDIEDVTDAWVGSTVEFWKGTRRAVMKHTRESLRFMLSFDDGKPVEPCTLEIIDYEEVAQ